MKRYLIRSLVLFLSFAFESRLGIRANEGAGWAGPRLMSPAFILHSIDLYFSPIIYR